MLDDARNKTPKPLDAPPEPESHQYWKATNGHIYLEAIRGREAQGNRTYTQQEVILTSLVQSEQRRLGRPIDVLEFGCGFGRHAHYLSRLENVRYHGYDFSDEMLKPLRESPPPSLHPVDERIFSGETVGTAVGNRRFDLIFTVSVLIHNPPDRVAQALKSLTELTREDGMVFLIENQAVSFGVFENSWHQGCWLHAYQDLVPEGWDLHHGAGLIDTHDVYLLKRRSSQPGGGTRFFDFAGPERARDEGVPVSAETLKLRGLRKLRAWSEAVETTLKSGNTGSDYRVSELTELVNIERRRSHQRQRLLALADGLATARNTPLRRSHVEDTPRYELAVEERGNVLFDDALDTKWSHADPRLSRLTHVFHQEWHGIRAASAYAPGRKIAITAGRPLTREDLHGIVQACASSLTRAVVFQGFSSNAEQVVHLLRRVFGRGVRLYAVWHGSASQFHYSFEHDIFARLIELRQSGVLDGLGCVKPEMWMLSPAIHRQTLLNFAPRLADDYVRRRRTDERSAFVPTPNNWWKNFYTNVYVAAASRRLDRVYVTTPFSAKSELPFRNPVENVGMLQRAALFDRIAQSDALLNVTLSECQPMTALEGLAHGVGCLTGPLSLDELDRHPYQKLVQVQGTGSLAEIGAALEALLERQQETPEELAETVADFCRVLRAEAVRRYQEFTQL